MSSKRTSLCIDQKVLLIRAIEAGEKISNVGRRFGISPSTVSTIWKNKKNILEAEVDRKLSKKLKKPKYNDLDQAMQSWFYKQRQANMPVTGPILKAKAEKLSKKLGLTAFKASEGWLGKFKKRHNINFSKVNGKVRRIDSKITKTAEEILDSVIKSEKGTNEVRNSVIESEEGTDKEILDVVTKIEEHQRDPLDIVVKTDFAERPPNIKQALDAAELLQKYFLFYQVDPTLAQDINKIHRILQLKYSNKIRQIKLTDYYSYK